VFRPPVVAPQDAATRYCGALRRARRRRT